MSSTDQRGHYVGRPVQLAVMVILGALVLAACGSPAPKTTTTTTTKLSKSHVSSTASCTTPLLSMTAYFGGAAAGGSYYRFSAENVGPTKCSLDGYPTLAFFAPSAGGGAGSNSPVALTVNEAGPSPSTVNLASHTSAEFLMIFTDVPVDGAGCTSVASVNITPPHQTGSTPIAISFSPCGGVVKVYAFGPSGTENP